MKRQVSHHASGIIIASPENDIFLLSGYDEGYPREIFRGCPNIMGGNYEKGDRSPWHTLERELKEEFSFGQEVPNLASRDDRDYLVNEIMRHAEPFRDFLMTDPPLKKKEVYDFLYSIFQAKISDEAFTIAERNLEQGKKLVSEGVAHVFTLQDLEQKHLAWCSPVAMMEYLDRKDLPNPLNVRGESLGSPRVSYADYASDFDYISAPQ